MMEWQIPAKTFLLGEYVALVDGCAIILTTTPCFKISLSETPGLHGIHPESPAGQLWLSSGCAQYGLNWYDPYQGCGGLGASSAQFIGAFFATAYVQHHEISQTKLLEAYWQCAWNGVGLRPSGYDVIAQSMSGCVHLNRSKQEYKISAWPFEDLAFIIVHTENKLATHHHLQSTLLPNNLERLNQIVVSANQAFELAQSKGFIQAVNDYYEELLQMNLVSPKTEELIKNLKNQTEILAAKGCGALGADVLLLVITPQSLPPLMQRVKAMNLKILANHQNIYNGDCMWKR